MGNQLAMPFEQGFGLYQGDHVLQQFTEGFAFLCENLVVGIMEPPVRRMPIQQGAVNAVFFQHELQFLTQGLIDLTGDTSQQLFSWHDERLAAQPP